VLLRGAPLRCPAQLWLAVRAGADFNAAGDAAGLVSEESLDGTTMRELQCLSLHADRVRVLIDRVAALQAHVRVRPARPADSGPLVRKDPLDKFLRSNNVRAVAMEDRWIGDWLEEFAKPPSWYERAVCHRALWLF
jgi:hypothetical protein